MPGLQSDASQGKLTLQVASSAGKARGQIIAMACICSCRALLRACCTAGAHDYMSHVAVLAPWLLRTSAWSVTVSGNRNTHCGTIVVPLVRNSVQTIKKAWLIVALYLSVFAALAALPLPGCLIDAAEFSGSRADGIWALATRLWLAAVVVPVTGQAVPCAEGLTSPAPHTSVLALAPLAATLLAAIACLVIARTWWRTDKVVFSSCCLLTTRDGKPVFALRVCSGGARALLRPEIYIGYSRV